MTSGELRPTGMWSGTQPGTSPFVGFVSHYLKEIKKIALFKGN